MNLNSKYIKNDGEKKDNYYTEKIIMSEAVRRDINKSNDIFELTNLCLLYIYYQTGDIAAYETNLSKLLNFKENLKKCI